VFLVNSRYPYFRDTNQIFYRTMKITVLKIKFWKAALLPKVQGYFAKFLHLRSFIALVYSTHPPVLDFIYLKDFTN